jgi:YegS/Rv2252/BmrU family lipid kinase
MAGERRTERLWRVLDLIVTNGMRANLVETRAPGDAAALTRAAVADRARFVVAAGGDGTIAEVASGLIGSTARLGVIPLGTANVLAHELGLPFKPRDIAAAFAFGRTRTLWPGLALGAERRHLFVQMVGVGFDAQVVQHVTLGMKRVLGRTAYLLQGLRELQRYSFRPLSVRIDGTDTEAASVIVSKGRFYGGRYLLAPDATPGERGFSVSLFDRGDVGAALYYGAALQMNCLSHAPGVRRLRAARVDFIGNELTPTQADGDRGGRTPLSIVDAPQPIEVVAG